LTLATILIVAAHLEALILKQVAGDFFALDAGDDDDA